MTSLILGRWPQFILCALVAGLLGCTGYWMLFTTFMPYDDEGYILWSVRQFCEGHPLYTEVFSQYGPMFYAWYRFWHATTGLVFDSESGRWLTLVYWLIASGACGSMVWQFTRRWLPTVAAGILSFVTLEVMTHEPFHPGGFLAAISAVGVAVCLAALLRGAHRTFVITGAAVGTAMALMKINVGIFFLIALGSWVALSTEGRKWRWVARVLTVLGAVTTPIALMKMHLHDAWVRDFVVVFVCGALAMLVTFYRAERPAGFTWRDWLWMLSAAALVTAGMVVFCAATGTPPAQFVNGVLIAPLRMPEVNVFPIHWHRGAVAAAFLALVVALVRLAPAKRSLVIAGLRVLGGLAVLGSFLGFGDVEAFHFVFEFAPALAWLMATPLTTPGEVDPLARGRLWLAWCALWETLQAYPVGGSQMAWGCFLFVPLLVAGTYEALCFLLQLSPRPRFTLPVAGGVLLTLAAIADWQMGRDSLLAYLQWERLGLPGAQSLRLSGGHTSELRIITRNVATHGGLLFSAPGLFSFNIWSQKPTPTTYNATVWKKLLSDEQRAAITHRLHEDKTSLVIAWFTHDMFYNGDGFLATFRPAFFVGNYALWTHPDTTILALGTARIEQTSDGHAYFVIVADPTQHRIAGLQIRDSDQHSVVWKSGITPGSGWRITPADLQGHATGETQSETQPFTLPGYAFVQVEITPALARLDRNQAEIALIDTDGAVVGSYRFDKLPGTGEFIPR